MRWHDPHQRASAPAGALLIVLGLVLLVATQTGIGALLVPGAMGALFLVAYFYRRRYGLLVAGCVLAGLGAGVALQGLFGYNGADDVLGLGAGFVAIFAIDSLRGLQHAHWWPLLPGAILLLAGFDIATGNLVTLQWLAGWWPVVVVAIGVLIVVRGMAHPRPHA